MILERSQCEELIGFGPSAASLIIYFALLALGAGIFKMLFASRGRVSFGGISITWGN